MVAKILTIEEIMEIAIKRGGKCLSTVYINSKTKLLWECSKGHQWEASSNSIRQGHWCPECAGLKKGTIEEMREIAIKREGKCLSPVYINSKTKLLWECSKGHQWEANPNNVKLGSWCPKCIDLERGTIKEIRELAIKRGGKCLSTVYINSKTKLLWECSKGHQWEASSNSIKLGTWCPECAGLKKCTIEEMRKIAVKRGGKCLSPIYINARTKLLWECSEGHQWEATSNNVKLGTWCPKCAHLKDSLD